MDDGHGSFSLFCGLPAFIFAMIQFDDDPAIIRKLGIGHPVEKIAAG
jgi:hypothetical protein